MRLFVLFLVPCSSLSDPNNGMITCSSNNYVPGDTCTVTCDDNSLLMGSGTRTCGNFGLWSGTVAMCIRISK